MSERMEMLESQLLGLPSREEEEAEACMRSFSHFVRAAWPVVESGTPLIWEPHIHVPLCAHVEELIKGFVRVKLHEAAEANHGQLPSVPTAPLPLDRARREVELRERARLKHLHQIGHRLEVLLRSGEVEWKPQLFNNLLVNLGTGYGKSRLCCVLAPAWMWLQWPGAWQQAFSVNPRSVVRDAGLQLNLIRSEWWQRTFRPWWMVDPAKDGESHFRNTAGGVRMAVGWNASAQGDHAHLQLIDDPEDPKKVFSEGERKATQQSWDGRIKRRIHPGGTSIRIATQQRLLQGDWSDHAKDSGEWEHLEFSTVAEATPSPCKCPSHRRGRTLLGYSESAAWPFAPGKVLEPRAPGQLLAPRLVPEKEVASRKANPTIFAAQDQQRPQRLEGNIFPEQLWWYWRFADEPEVAELRERTLVIPDRGDWADYFEQALISSDLSFGLTQDGSADCLGLWGRREHRRLLLDVRWAAMTMTVSRRAARELRESNAWALSLPILIERAANGAGVADGLTEGAEEIGEKALEGVILIPAMASKTLRALSIQHLQVAGNIVLPLHHHRRPDMVAEGNSFPRTGRRNDFIDMMSQALRYWQSQDQGGVGADGLYKPPPQGW